MPMINIEALQRSLRRYKDKLVNFTRRNKELHYKESKSTSVNITRNPLLDLAIEDIKELKSYRGIRFQDKSCDDLFKNKKLNLTEHLLISKFENRTLEKRLDKLRLADAKFKREFGLPGAWLLGPFLCFRTSPDSAQSDLAISPLFKLSVDLSRSKRKDWLLNLKGDDLVVNPSLRIFLKKVFCCELPEVFESESIQAAVAEIQKRLLECGRELHIGTPDLDAVPKLPSKYRPIKNEEGDVISREPIDVEAELDKRGLSYFRRITNRKFLLLDTFYLDHLNQNKLTLLSDYDVIEANAEKHPIITELLLGAQGSEKSSQGQKTPRELEKYKEAYNFFVVESDSTQHRAMDRAVNERAVVIQGPPGTGKSQTITNLIAKLVGEGKRVLFVSEKRAALDVVFTRLQKAKLDSQIILMHGSDLNRAQFYQGFVDNLVSHSEPTAKKKWEFITSELDRVKQQIGSYCIDQKTPHEPSELNLSDIYTILSQVSETKNVPKIGDFFSQMSYSNLESASDDLACIQDLIAEMPAYFEHPWLYRKDTVLNSEKLTNLLQQLVAACKGHIQVLVTSEEAIEQLFPKSNYSAVAVAAGQLAATSQTIKNFDDSWKSLINCTEFPPNKRAQMMSRAKLLIDSVKRGMEYFPKVKASTPIELIEELEKYFQVRRGIFDWLTPRFWRQRRIKNQVIGKTGDVSVICHGYLEYVKSFRELVSALSIVKFHGFPSVFVVDEVATFCDTLLQNLRAVDVVKTVRESILGIRGVIPFMNTSDLIQWMKDLEKVKVLAETKQAATVAIAALECSANGHFTNPLLTENQPLQNIKVLETLLKTAPDLNQLDKIDIKIFDLETRLNVRNLKDLIVSELRSVKGHWGHEVCLQAVLNWRDTIRQSSIALRSFDGNTHRRLIDRFNTLVDAHQEQAKEVVVHEAEEFRRKGKIRESSSANSLLRHQARITKRHKSPREVMEKGALETMMMLKPCWLMSPLSISQMLPNHSGLFDVVIFDEASQVRVEDSMPSIYRAKQLVVVGDNKQMPPTNVFGMSQSEDDDDDEDEDLEESILDLASRVYPPSLLEWHYRSRSEALISFSNHAFYGGRLIAVPNPTAFTEGKPIEFKLVKDAYFNTRDGNKEEAKVVVNELARLIVNNPKISIGVIAMGSSQQKAIDEAIDDLAEKDEVFKRAYEECSNLEENGAFTGVFVKNLENVQGDERDIILISVGYAPSAPGRKLYKNFGPLSKKGGGRRLNVAITRARDKITVFSSFEPTNLSIDEEAFAANPAATTFARYVHYAKAISEGEVEKAKSILHSFPMSGVPSTNRKVSRFSEDVRRELKRLGHNVVTEVGTCGYFIDLAVEHPNTPNTYIVGIECDGAIFHSSDYARDRDRIRENLLRERGWKIERVWSTDWSKDRDAEIRRLDARIKELLSGLELKDPQNLIQLPAPTENKNMPEIVDKADYAKLFLLEHCSLKMTSAASYLIQEFEFKMKDPDKPLPKNERPLSQIALELVDTAKCFGFEPFQRESA